MRIGRFEILFIWHREEHSERRNIIYWLEKALIEHPVWPKIRAIKEHRARYGSTLKEAKEAVEAVMHRHPGRWEPSPGAEGK